MPEPPKLPDDLADELAFSQSRFDAHAESLKQWAMMAAQFHDYLAQEFGERLADKMILQWQRAWFDSLYAGLMDGPE